VTTGRTRPVVLRRGVEIDDPLAVVVGFLGAPRPSGTGDPLATASFNELDLRAANGAGARISAVEQAAILERRSSIERALGMIAPDASLAGSRKSIPWPPLRQLFDAFSGIRGVGFSKMTKALHSKRPGLVPMLDSVVQKYLEGDDPGAEVPFGERAVALVRGYKRDLDSNRSAVRGVRQELERLNYRLTEVRILDLLIWSIKDTLSAGPSRQHEVSAPDRDAREVCGGA
jgi:Family of unknown function (DUF6308)